MGVSFGTVLYQTFAKGVLGVSLYFVQSMLFDSPMTSSGIILSIANGMISVYFYDVPALSSLAISVGLIIIDKIQSYIESVHNKNETEPTT